MSTRTQSRYRFGVALLLVVLLCAACGAKKAEPPPTSPLLTLLAGIPQDPVSQAEAFIYFMDSSAMEAAYNLTRPPSVEAFLDWLDDDESIAWWVVGRETLGLLGESWYWLDAMPEMVGFNNLEVDQAIQFGSPPSRGLILAGSFDAKAVSATYQTNLDFEPNDFDGKTVWCWVEGCAHGGQDLKNAMRENPFGGRLGQRQPMIISNNLLMASPDLELVLAHLDAAGGTLPSLADDQVYRAAIGAISQDAYILQAIIANQNLAQRMANRMPVEVWDQSGVQLVNLETYLEDFQELPPYDLLILADVVTKDEQVARLGIVYQNAKSAEIAASILLERLASHRSPQFFHLSLAKLLADLNVTDPRYFVHQEADRATLVLEYPAQKATSEELVQMKEPWGYEGTTTPPGRLYQPFFKMFIMDDTGWLSTASRAELEAIQIGTLVGIEVTVGLSDIADGVIDEADFGGVVIVELGDGTTIKAIWDRSLGDDVVGGMRLEVAPSSDPGIWKVLRIVETP